MTRLVQLLRIVLGVLALAAVATGFWRAVEGGYDPLNYVSFFTIQTTPIAVVVLAVTAVTPPERRPHALDWWRGATAVYLTVTFVVVIVLLEGRFGWNDWTDFVTHKLLPVAIVADFLLDPPRNRLTNRDGLWFISYGVLWLGWTFVHGAASGWYPYGFLDPAVAGVPGALLTSAAIVVAGVVLSLLYVTLGRYRARQPHDSLD